MLPLVPLYAAGVALRSAGLRVGIEPVQRLQWPVISVGNLSAGGTGKTPFVLALVRLLEAMGMYVDVLSRGYGRSGNARAWVNPAGTAEEFGDEPLLIAREAGVPVFVGARRWEAGMLAEAGSQTVRHLHLLDDGFQHRQLARDVDVVLVNSEDLDDWLLPAGNLREPLRALRRATVFAVSVEDEGAVARLRMMGLEQPVWRFRREMVVPEVGGPVYAFCGIARPEQFFAGLERAGLTLVAKKVFRDHYRYTTSDVRALEQFADRMGASGGLVTTEKDRVRIGELAALLGEFPLVTAGLRIVLEDEAGLAAFLRDALKIGDRKPHPG
jgi:tetraacyldisaccharide 4'-kinase